MKGSERREKERNRSFYRIVATDSPSLRDFLSNVELGKTLVYDNPEARRLWAGIPVYDSRRRARQRARSAPWLEKFIAELRVPLDGSIQYERTGKSHGHYTLGANADILLALVYAVFPVSEAALPRGGSGP